MTQDLYALLGVARVDAHGLRWAYERKLAEAARFGALRQAQELDSAYEVLRDANRRALYDRHGISTALPRQHPLERYAAPRAVPFRAWSPVQDVAVFRPRAGACGSSTGRRVAVLMLVLAGMSWATWGWAQLRSDDSVGTTSRDQIQIICDATPTASGYTYIVAKGSPVDCTNGAPGRWMPMQVP